MQSLTLLSRENKIYIVTAVERWGTPTFSVSPRLFETKHIALSCPFRTISNNEATDKQKRSRWMENRPKKCKYGDSPFIHKNLSVMNHLHLGFVGTGRIARALIAGLSQREHTTFVGFDKEPIALASISADYPVQPCLSIEEVALGAQVIILAVKPYQMEEVLGELKPSLTANHLLISVAAGISSEFIRKNSRESTRVIRVMPNTPAFVGEGMTALCRGKMAADADVLLASELFSSIGQVTLLDELQMDAATALSGSGPAYKFHILDSLAEGGVQCGLSRDEALILGAQTMIGAATMVLSGKKSPEELKHEEIGRAHV